jgi:DNA-binding transcriptional LysR family regulator
VLHRRTSPNTGTPSRRATCCGTRPSGYRFPQSGAIDRWEPVENGRDLALDVPGAITVNDGALAIALARRGLGLTYGPDVLLDSDFTAGTLVPTLRSFASTSAGFFLYFPQGARRQPKLRALTDTMRREFREAPRADDAYAVTEPVT